MSVAWYTVQTKRHGEGRVARHLASRAIPAFLPLVEVARRRNGIRHTGLEPLFPGYLFVQMEAVDRSPHCWHAVRWSPGVQRILGVADEPVPVPDEAIQAIQERTRDLGFVRPGHRFAAGDRVRFRSGSLAGLEAILESAVPRAGRVRVLLELLGRVLRVEADELDLESA